MALVISPVKGASLEKERLKSKLPAAATPLAILRRLLPAHAHPLHRDHHVTFDAIGGATGGAAMGAIKVVQGYSDLNRKMGHVNA
jgi:hypothetical protein